MGTAGVGARDTLLVERASAPVLVVDDDSRVRRMLCWALREEGLDAESAEDGPAALDYLAHQRPAAIVLDMGLPRVGGLEVAEEAREAYGASLPIVVMTADDNVAQKARRIGAVAYFHKPFDIEDLLGVVRRAVA